MQDSLAAIVGVKRGTLPIRYLGVPLTCKKLSKKECQPLLEKFTVSISSWSSRFLSYAGRLQLTDSTLGSLYGYWCTVFLLPKHLISSIEKLCCSFLWKGDTSGAMDAKVS